MTRRIYEKVLITVVALSAATQNCVAKPPATGEDKLLSFTYAFDTDLRPTFEEKLLVTPANYGRMIRMHGPHDVGESAVSVYCTEAETSDAACHVTLTRAQANMDYTMEEHREENDPLQHVRDIAIVRKDAELPKKTATLFRDCLRIMIPPPGDPNRLHPLTISDDNRVEFWLVESDSAPRKGERAEQPGKKTRTLIRIGDLLARYCEATQARRPGIAKQIQAEASRILSK